MHTVVGEPYALRSDHRDGHSKKSQWLISQDEEVAAFEHAHNIKALATSEGPAWGLHLANDRPSILGCSAAENPPRRELFLAKFVCKRRPTPWHGYPADYRSNVADRPDADILKGWYSRGYIQKHEVAKVRQGKRCSLSN